MEPVQLEEPTTGADETAETTLPIGQWTTLETGLDLGVFEAPSPAPVGDSLVRVLRVDPARFELALGMGSRYEPPVLWTARQWAEAEGLVAAINSSMFQQDHRTSTSLMVAADHVNNARVTRDKTVLAFGPSAGAPEGTPPVRILDRDCDDLEAIRPHYDNLVQSIRMLSCNGTNVWKDSARIWSHAVIGIDTAGRPLLIHARAPYSTHDFIEVLRALPLDLERLQYAEGGPEAQLYVTAGGRELELFGSFETGFFDDDGNQQAWPVPNVIGVKRR